MLKLMIDLPIGKKKKEKFLSHSSSLIMSKDKRTMSSKTLIKMLKKKKFYIVDEVDYGLTTPGQLKVRLIGSSIK